MGSHISTSARIATSSSMQENSTEFECQSAAPAPCLAVSALCEHRIRNGRHNLPAKRYILQGGNPSVALNMRVFICLNLSSVVFI